MPVDTGTDIYLQTARLLYRDFEVDHSIDNVDKTFHAPCLVNHVVINRIAFGSASDLRNNNHHNDHINILKFGQGIYTQAHYVKHGGSKQVHVLVNYQRIQNLYNC